MSKTRTIEIEDTLDDIVDNVKDELKDDFIDFLKGLENPLLGILAGAIFTALVQSSSAFTGILIVLAQQGLITLEAGIPMIFGANIMGIPA